MIKNLFTFLFILFSVTLSVGQILINEYSASNLDVFKDSFNKTEDWVELYNSGNQDIDISGWYISDKDDELDKWIFPTGTSLAPGEFLIIFCSGKDGSYNGELHSNFKLTQTEGDDVLVLSDAQENIVDRVGLNLTLTEHSNCRSTDGDDIWSISTSATPGSSNNNVSKYERYTERPSMSLQAGFYNGTQEVTITNNENNSVLRYTLDGSNPLADSPIYDGPITVDSTIVVKAKAFSNDSNILPGKIEFNTYFIDESFSLPVFSVAADRVTNLANGAGAILPIGSLEYFKDNELITSSFGELNRHGQDSWVLDHRSIDWISRDEMGYSKAVNAPIISSSDRDAYQRFMFRNSGDDNYPAIDDFEHRGSTHLRDEYVQTLAQEGNMRLDLRKSERVILFLNGQYWGVYGMREKVVDHDYTAEYYDQGKEDLQFLSTWGTTDAEYGGTKALQDWIALRDFILNNDMSEPSNYSIAEDSLNMISLIDYFTMNQATVAVDWLNYNTGWWRGLNPDGSHKKWGYMLWDLDATFDYYINYTAVPNRNADASMCDIYAISDSIDQFFLFGGDFSICDFFGGNNSPYPDEDPIFAEVVNAFPDCCTDWTDTCQGYYDDPSTIPDDVEDDLRNCPSVISGSSPYPPEDSIFALVVEQDPFCCQEWDQVCQGIYDALSADPVDISDCPIIINGTSPYPADDPALIQVITSIPPCCDEWTPNCQIFYDLISDNFQDFSDCPVFVNQTSPYLADDPKIPFVMEMNPDCCDEWGLSCQRDYELLGGDEFAEPDDPLITNIEGNFGRHEKILLKLFEESPEFKQLYYSRYADLMNTVFTCENMNDLLDRMIAEIEAEMPKQVERWGGTMSEWRRNLDRLREFINERCRFLNDSAMECHNEVEGQYTVTLMTEPENVARVDFNTLRLDNLPWSGDYFGNMDNLVDVRVFDEFRNEYVFSHWESKMGNNISPSEMQEDIVYKLSMPDTLVAHFRSINLSGGNGNIVINEFMASNDATAADQDGEYDDWIELYNKGNEDVDISGFFLSDNAQNLPKYQIPDNTLLASDDYLIVWADEDGSQDGLHANFKLSRSGETIFLLDRDTTIVDQIAYTDQETDVSYARKPNGTGDFESSSPTFNANNDGGSSTEDVMRPDDQLVVFPNPANNQVTIQLKRNGHKLTDVVIRDVLGKVVYSNTKLNEHQYIVRIDNLTSGLYFITANDFYTEKIIKK